ncbi:MAG: polysaccharide deacetylase family protein [Patescibacteria group bacterium]|nr:polysaccharide deacetylase family protein [Patescibacteria group bacterium]
MQFGFGGVFMLAIVFLVLPFFSKPESESIVHEIEEHGLELTGETLPVEIPEEVTVPILVYHHIREPKAGLSAADRQYEVTPEVFEAQLAYLQEEGFESIPISDIAAAFSEGKPLPERPVVITFDDGRDTQYTEALPLLKEYGFTATFFVFTNAPNRPGYVTWEQLAEMRDAGMEIGSHTVYHPFLTKSSDEELISELQGSRATIQEKLGVPGDVLAYPFGLHDERVLAAVWEAGYIAGRDLDHVVVHGADEIMTLGSYIVTSNMGWFERILR